MEQGRSRKWGRRAAAVLVLAAVAGGGYAAFRSPAVQARYAAHRFGGAATAEERAGWADKLAADGEHGLPRLVGFLKSENTDQSAAAAGAFDRQLNALPDGDPRAVTLAGHLLAAFGDCPDPGRRAILDLLPVVLKRTGTVYTAQCREVVTAGLKMPATDARLLAIRLAMHPGVKMRGELVALLEAREPEVRRAAMFAVGPATDGDPVIGDEELFRWLHDPDDGVRKGCYDALVSRGRNETEIALGRRLSHPDAAERLKLLLDLRQDDDIPDPEPWLERLGRDPEPAVRAGAARVAVEVAAERRVPVPVWVGRLADADPDPTVRRVASFFRSQPTAVTGNDVRPAGGP